MVSSTKAKGLQFLGVDMKVIFHVSTRVSICGLTGLIFFFIAESFLSRLFLCWILLSDPENLRLVLVFLLEAYSYENLTVNKCERDENVCGLRHPLSPSLRTAV